VHQEQRNDKALTHFCGSSRRMIGFSTSSRPVAAKHRSIAADTAGHKKTASGKEAAWS
jgi:hypothetical protein